MGIGKRLRELREREKLTQEELAEIIGVTPSAVGNYERGISHPKEEVLLRIFTELGWQPNEVFRDYVSGLSDEDEHQLMYRGLDEHGRSVVDACTQLEYARCADEVCTVAARGNGAPRQMKLRKRPGAGDISSAPEYDGGRR